MTGTRKVLFYFTMAMIMCFIANLSQTVASEVIKWKMTTSWPENVPNYTDMAELFSKYVENMSDGRMVIKVLPGGAVVPPLEVTEAVKNGIVEMGHLWSGYDIGVDPTSCLFGGYAGSMESVPLLHWLYEGGGKELWGEWRKDKFGIKAFPCGIRPPEVFLHSHKPIHTLDDFKGLKIRTVGVWSKIVPELGASVVALPGGEVFDALKSRVIDATEWASPGENVISRFHEIAKYVIVPGAHQPAAPFELLINNDKWNSLPEDLKQIIDRASELVTFKSWCRIGRLDMSAMETFRKAGNEIIFLSPEIQTRCHELGKKWAEDNAKNDPFFKKVMDSQNAFENEWKGISGIRYFKYLDK